MEQIWQTVLAIIGSVGGAGAIIVAVVKFASNIIAERLSQKYEIKISKELESYKAVLDKKTYISRTKFDVEFQIYRELSEKGLTMIESVYWLFPSGIDYLPQDVDKRKDLYLQRYHNAGEAINAAQKEITANAPFISANFYNKFEELRRLCVQQYNSYTWCGALKEKTYDFCKTKADAETQCWQRTEEISEKQQQLITELREYLENLDVMEDKKND